MQQNTYLRGMTRRGFVVSLGPGIYVLGMAVAHGAPLKKVPTSTGIDALFVPFVVAAERKIFEKYGLETSYKPFDDGNVALDAVLTGRTVAYPRATGGHLYFMRYVKKYNLPVDKIKVKFLQAPEMVAALERRD